MSLLPQRQTLLVTILTCSNNGHVGVQLESEFINLSVIPAAIVEQLPEQFDGWFHAVVVRLRHVDVVEQHDDPVAFRRAVGAGADALVQFAFEQELQVRRFHEFEEVDVLRSGFFVE